MPETRNPGNPVLEGTAVWEGLEIDYGTLRIPEEDMIAFAKANDPLPFHTDPDYAAEHVFGRIIASGSQLFMEYHKRHFIPQFGKSIVAGLSIDHWRFHRPHFPEMEVRGLLRVIKISPKPEKGIVVIHWRYIFEDGGDSPMQTADFTILHRPDNFGPHN